MRIVYTMSTIAALALSVPLAANAEESNNAAAAALLGAALIGGTALVISAHHHHHHKHDDAPLIPLAPGPVMPHRQIGSGVSPFSPPPPQIGNGVAPISPPAIGQGVVVDRRRPFSSQHHNDYNPYK